MILHGTETPAHAGDPVTPKQRGTNAGSGVTSAASEYSSEIDHNSLEFEASNSDQWRDLHKVRDWPVLFS